MMSGLNIHSSYDRQWPSKPTGWYPPGYQVMILSPSITESCSCHTLIATELVLIVLRKQPKYQIFMNHIVLFKNWKTPSYCYKIRSGMDVSLFFPSKTGATFIFFV